MCIMEVREGQHSSTIAQAMAHNCSTIERDLDMYELLLAARGEHALLHEVQGAHEHLRRAYAGLLGSYGVEIGKAVQDTNGHVHSSHEGNERSLVSVAHHDAALARRFMTR